MAIATITETVTRSSIMVFNPLRRWKLFRCPYCLAHWVAIPLCNWDPIQWAALVCGSAIFGIAIEKYLKDIEYSV